MACPAMGKSRIYRKATALPISHSLLVLMVMRCAEHHYQRGVWTKSLVWLMAKCRKNRNDGCIYLLYNFGCLSPVLVFIVIGSNRNMLQNLEVYFNQKPWGREWPELARYGAPGPLIHSWAAEHTRLTQAGWQSPTCLDSVLEETS